MENGYFKYRVLYSLYENLYGFVILDKKNRNKWIIWEDSEEGDHIAELKNTSHLPIDQRIEIHLTEYKILKEKYKDLKIGKNGRCLLF